MKTFVIRLAYVGALLFLIGCTDNSETIIDEKIELTPNDELGLSYTDPDSNGTDGDDSDEYE